MTIVQCKTIQLFYFEISGFPIFITDAMMHSYYIACVFEIYGVVYIFGIKMFSTLSRNFQRPKHP